MNMESVIANLQSSISEGSKENQDINEDQLADHLESASKIREFYDLPFSNICSIVKKSQTKDSTTIISIISGLYKYDHKNIPVLLEFLEFPKSELDECVHIISAFSSSPICVHLGNIYEEYYNRPDIDWRHLLKQKESEIISLKQDLEENERIKDCYHNGMENMKQYFKDMKYEKGWTPLHFAVLNEEEETVNLLILNGFDVNTKTLLF